LFRFSRGFNFPEKENETKKHYIKKRKENTKQKEKIK